MAYPPVLTRAIRCAAATALSLALVACGGADRTNDSLSTSVASQGQVAESASPALRSLYGAARLADQASFGPSPALVTEIQRVGVERWVDEQLALTPTTLDVAPFSIFNSASIPPEQYYAWVLCPPQSEGYERLMSPGLCGRC